MAPKNKVFAEGNPRAARVGLREIAHASNVSIPTVSRALSGKGRVDPNIHKRVWQAAKKLGIDPAERNKNRTLAFLVSNRALLHEFHSRILTGAEAYCTANGWDMIFLTFNYSPYVPWTELHLPRILQRSDFVRGVILAGTPCMNLVHLLTDKGIPYSVLGNNLLGGDEPIKAKDAVFADDIQGGYDAARHLIDLGHRRIWFVGNTRMPWFARCFKGYSRAMKDAGLTPQEIPTDSEDDAESGYLSTKSLLSRCEPVTAILAGNDPTAHGIYKALREKSIIIPRDISVVGCDDTLGTWLNPALSTVREFPEQLGKHLVQVLLNRIQDPEQTSSSVMVPTEFVRRESCGPPPRPAG